MGTLRFGFLLSSASGPVDSHPLKAKIDWDYMGEATLGSDFSLLYETAFSCFSSRGSVWAVDFSKSA